MTQRICEIEGCNSPHKAKGMCLKHYQTAHRAGKVGRQLETVSPGELRVAPAPPRMSNKYSDIQVEEALLAVVMSGGVVREAAALVDIPKETIRDWTNLHAGRLAELRAAHGPELEKRAVDGLMAFVTAAEGVKRTALESTQDALDAGEIKDPSSALKNISISQGIAVTKVMELTGRPTANQIKQSPAELLAGLARLGAIVNSTAVEIPAVDSEAHQLPVAADADSIEAKD